jgi:ribosomal protein L11 methylase PrmA
MITIEGMNTAEPRWKVVVSIEDGPAWELLLAELAPECVLELDGRAEVYFARREQAEEAARRWRLSAPARTEAGGGEVFGESPHPTTELCLTLLTDVVRAGAWVADIGSGSGRLAEAAVRLGARCVAVDIDWPAAVASRGSGAFTVQGSADALRGGHFDGVVANLHLALWRSLAPEIARICAPAAWIAASGFLRDQEAEARALAGSLGFHVTRTAERAGWLGLLARRSL